MRTIPSLLVAAALSLPALAAAQPAGGYGYAPPAPTVGPDRSGFTLELNLGFGITRVSPDEGDTRSENGLAGLNLGLGGWVNERTAITARFAGTQFTQSFGSEDVSFIHGFFGPAVQYMVNDQAWVGGGLGWSILTTDQEDADSETALGLDLRAGFNFYQGTKHAFNASAEINPGFHDDGTVTSIGLLVGWQML